MAHSDSQPQHATVWIALGSEKGSLCGDVNRLSRLVGQLLDLQRLRQGTTTFGPVDLVAVSERVLLDIAPLAFRAGYEMRFESQLETMIVTGDDNSIARAITSLLQNAISQGGRRGTIQLIVREDKSVEIIDEGEGIAPEDPDLIFRPFHRLHQSGRGAGLGLDLVRKIMHIHGGRVELRESDGKGARFALAFVGRTDSAV